MNPYAVSALFSETPGLPADEDYPAWRNDALCVQSDPEAWFPEKGGSTRQPKAICRRCPARVPCLRMALIGGDEYGVWGGLSHQERVIAAQEHRRGVSIEEIIDAADESQDARHAAAAEHSRTTVARASAIAASRDKADRSAYFAAESSITHPKAAA